MLKSKLNSFEDVEDVTELLYEQYLPRLFQYVNYWVNNKESTEELTLKIFMKALVKCRNRYMDEKKFSIGIFTGARKEIQRYLKASYTKPLLPELSTQEREVISLRLGAVLNNQMISNVLGISELKVGRIVYKSLCKLKDCKEVPA